MKKLIVFIVAAVLVYGYTQDWDFRIPGTAAPTEAASNLQQAFELRLGDIQVSEYLADHLRVFSAIAPGMALFRVLTRAG